MLITSISSIRTILYLVSIGLFCLVLNVRSNDSDFYGGGGGILFPVFNDNVSVKKEVLKISHTKKWREKRYESDDLPLHVEIDYEFYNHGGEQELLIGFESMLGGEHQDEIPNIANFKVIVNGLMVHHESKNINDPYSLLNNDNGNRLDSIYSKDSSGQPNRYIKYFKALFKHGLNTISHSYECGFTSVSVGPVYSYEYDLMPAMRWKNRQIDDFTLILDFGDLSHYLVSNMTKMDSNKWTFNGDGKVKVQKNTIYSEGDDSMYYSVIYCKHGKVIFKSNNFKPISNLHILFANSMNSYMGDVPFELPFTPDYDDQYSDGYNLKEKFIESNLDTNVSKRIYRNLPFARRGYIFKDKVIQDYYKTNTLWYTPDPTYKGSTKDFSKYEKDIIKGNSKIFDY